MTPLPETIRRTPVTRKVVPVVAFLALLDLAVAADRDLAAQLAHNLFGRVLRRH